MNNRASNIEKTVESAYNNYIETRKVSYVFDPVTGQISSNISKFCIIGSHLCITALCVPIFEGGIYKGYFFGEKVRLVNEGVTREEDINEYLFRKLRK